MILLLIILSIVFFNFLFNLKICFDLKINTKKQFYFTIILVFITSLFIGILLHKIPEKFDTFSEMLILFLVFFYFFSCFFYRINLFKLFFFFLGNLSHKKKKIMISMFFISFFNLKDKYEVIFILIFYLFFFAKLLYVIFLLKTMNLEHIWVHFFVFSFFEIVIFFFNLNSLFTQILIFTMYGDIDNNKYILTKQGKQKMSMFVIERFLFNINKSKYIDGISIKSQNNTYIFLSKDDFSIIHSSKSK